MHLEIATKGRVVTAVMTLAFIGLNLTLVHPNHRSLAAQDESKANRDISADDNDITETLNAYLATARFPSPVPIEPELFTKDVEAHWSNGRNYRGRDNVVAALQASQDELAEYFKTFEATASELRITQRGSVAWVSCRLKLGGEMIEAQPEFHRAIRATFILVKNDETWRIAYEHSEALADE